MISTVVPFSLKDAPALIEKLFPVQKLSAEVFKEQMAVHGKTLTALGSYWKGRKPLILNKACILGCLLPATKNTTKDLEIFEKLMAMDEESFVARWPRRPKPKDILGKLTIPQISRFFNVEPDGVLPESSPIDWTNPLFSRVKVNWRDEISVSERLSFEVRLLPKVAYRKRVDEAHRPEEVVDVVHNHIWDAVNLHLKTQAKNFPELVEQLGIMRFGHRPKFGDTFSGSGQIPFEAARLGCHVYASDLNPVACMLTWGAFNIVGGAERERKKLSQDQHDLVAKVQSEIDKLNVDSDGKGWSAKVFLYCVETRCPQTGWMVPLLPTRLVSNRKRAYVELIPDYDNKCYEIKVRIANTDLELQKAEMGTIYRDSKYDEASLVHILHGVEYKTKVSTLRGDFQKPDGTTGNRLRMWSKSDFISQADDIFHERLYCIQWTRPKTKGNGYEYEFRTVTSEDLEREKKVEKYISMHLEEWQENGWVPDMRIEPGGPPRYQALDLIRARGWTHWHHAFNPRQLLVAGLVNQFNDSRLKFGLTQILNRNSRLSHWDFANVKAVFYNQALNTIYSYGCRGFIDCVDLITNGLKSFPISSSQITSVEAVNAAQYMNSVDMFVTDPPYGDAVKYEEILDFFIAWLRKNPPPEFENWIWDSRRTLAVKGEGEDFRRGMVAAYRRMTECMSDDGLQVIMFTHQSGSIWADMAGIVWASGLQVTAAWYVVTETDSALRDGSYVKGTVLLVCRKRRGLEKTTRDDLAWEIQEEVEAQVSDLAGLNQEAKGLYREENVFEDADIQMAGYAAALRVLTKYSLIDGREMAVEAIRPRVKGQTTFVDGLITFAVDTANQCLVPQGIEKRFWDKFTGAERFYLKLLDMEARGTKTLDNYQNFAKAFKVRDFKALMGDQRANQARLKSAVEFARSEMSEGSELHHSTLRAVLYAVMELVKNVDGSEVLAHLTLNIPDYYGDMTQRELAAELADYLAKRLESLRPEEAAAARVLRELVKNQRLG